MEKVFLVLIFLGCALLPFSPSLANILFMAFGGGIVLENIFYKRFPQKKDWTQLWMLPSFFFIWALLGSIFSPYSGEALHLAKKFIPFMVFSLAYLFASKDLREKTPRAVSIGFIVGVSASIVFLLFKLITGFAQAGEESIWNIFSHRFTYFNFTLPLKLHPTYYSVWILLANYFVFNSKKLRPALKAILLSLFFIGMVFTMSRIALVLYGLQIIGVFFFLSTAWKIRYAIGAGILLLLGVYLSQYQLHNFYLLQRFSIELAWDTDADNSGTEINNRVADDSRTARWSAIWEKSLEQPIFGHGVGSEDSILAETYKENNLNISLERQYNTHNQYLFYLLEQGFLGLVLFLSFFVVQMVLAVGRKDLLSISLVIGLCLIFVFENYMYRSMGFLTMALFLTFMRLPKK